MRFNGCTILRTENKWRKYSFMLTNVRLMLDVIIIKAFYDALYSGHVNRACALFECLILSTVHANRHFFPRQIEPNLHSSMIVLSIHHIFFFCYYILSSRLFCLQTFHAFRALILLTNIKTFLIWLTKTPIKYEQ